MIGQFFKKNKKSQTVFRLSEMVQEKGSYKNSLADYEITPLGNDQQIVGKLPPSQARARYELISNELPKRADRFSRYLQLLNKPITLDGLQTWLVQSAELSTEPTDKDSRPHPFRPRLRAMHFDASCLAHQLGVQNLVTGSSRWSEGYAGDAPLFKHDKNLPVFPVIWSNTDTSVHINMHETIRQLCANVILGSQQKPLSQWLAELDTVQPGIHPVEQLRQYWEVEFEKDHGRSPNYDDLMTMVQDFGVNADDVPSDILEKSRH